MSQHITLTENTAVVCCCWIGSEKTDQFNIRPYFTSFPMDRKFHFFDTILCEMCILELFCKLTLYYMPCCIVIIASLHNWARNFDIITKMMHIIPPSVITFLNFIEWYRDLPEHYRFQNYQYSWNVWSSLSNIGDATM